MVGRPCQMRGRVSTWQLSSGAPHGCMGLPLPEQPHTTGSTDSPSCTEEEQHDSAMLRANLS